MTSGTRRTLRERDKQFTSGSYSADPDELLSDDGTVIYGANLSSGGERSTSSQCTIPTVESSWDEDFNAGTTAEIQQVLDAVDSFLYEDDETVSLSDELRTECERWKKRFVYLRVLGNQVNAPDTTSSGNAAFKRNPDSTER